MAKIAGSRILITGGAGFVGSAIADQLVEAGAAEVLILDNLVRGCRSNVADAMSKGNVRLIEGDVCDAHLVDCLSEGIDYVFHQAALRITHCAAKPREAVDVLIAGTQNVLESAVHHGIKKIVAASSASVYGEPSYLPMDESHPFNNRTLYGAGKIANEQMLRAYYEMYRMPYTALRYFNVYGPRMDLEGVYTEVLVRWLDAIEQRQAPRIFGDGKQSMDFVFVNDVARANLLALQSDANDMVFNVGSGVQTTLNELCELVLRIQGSHLRPEYHEARKVANISARQAEISAAKRVLGFSARMPLEEGLRELIKWRTSAKAESLVGVSCHS
jgi:UDP-glucose 4-epimerase